MATQADLNGMLERYTDSFCAFRIVEGARPAGPLVTESIQDEWLRAFRGARNNAREQLVGYIVELFLHKASTTVQDGESDIFIPGTELRTCVNMAAAGRLLRQADMLRSSGDDLNWLARAVTNKMHTYEHAPMMEARIVRECSTNTLKVFVAKQ